LTRYFANAAATPALRPFTELTTREHEVLELTATDRNRASAAPSAEVLADARHGQAGQLSDGGDDQVRI
jgi:hypothetical protein